MAKEFKFDIKETISVLKEGEWEKSILRMNWNDGADNIEIRNFNRSKNIMGKGIGLSDDEVEQMVNALIGEGYGDTEILKGAIAKRINIYETKEDEHEIDIDDGCIHVFEVGDKRYEKRLNRENK